jgi:hypothetical protein
MKRTAPVTFLIDFEENNLHRLAVTVHPNLRTFRRVTRKEGNQNAHQSEACCYQHNCLTYADRRIAHLHFCRERLNPEVIAHEATHAAHHRMRILGIPASHPEYEEQLATMVGDLTNRVIKSCRTLKIPIVR